MHNKCMGLYGNLAISSPKHKILGTRVYSPFTFVLSKNVFRQGMLVLLNPVCVLLSVECFMFVRATRVLQFSRLDDHQNTSFDRLKIVLFGPELSKPREARPKETFYTITDFTLSNVLRRNSK